MSACREFRSRLARLLSGRASSASFGALSWHEHLLGCADCRALIAAEQALEELLLQLPEPQLPPELAQRLLARLEPSRGETDLDSLLDRNRDVPVPKALAARMLARLDGARTAQREDAALDRLLDQWSEPEIPADLGRRTLARLALARRAATGAAASIAGSNTTSKHARGTRRAPPARPSASRGRLVLAAAALVTVALGAWLFRRADEPSIPVDSPLANAPRPPVAPVAPRERLLDEPPADLLASLDLLESWELVVDDSVESDMIALEAFDVLLLDVADELEAEPAPTEERRNG